MIFVVHHRIAFLHEDASIANPPIVDGKGLAVGDDWPFA